jgi:hypothetical protein
VSRYNRQGIDRFNSVFENWTGWVNEMVFNPLLHILRLPGHHTGGGSNADILVERSATRWLRLNGLPFCREQSLHRIYRSSSWIGGRLRPTNDVECAQPRHLTSR